MYAWTTRKYIEMIKAQEEAALSDDIDRMQEIEEDMARQAEHTKDGSCNVRRNASECRLDADQECERKILRFLGGTHDETNYRRR